jgi:hypothetical protein
MKINQLWTFIAKLFHKLLLLGFVLKLRKLELYGELQCIMGCDEQEDWNHLFECPAYNSVWKKIFKMTLDDSVIIFLKHDKISLQGENFVRNVLQKNLGITAKSKKFQKFQHLALEVKVDYNLMTSLRKDFNISLSDA